MSQRYQFINYSNASINVHVEARDPIQFYHLGTKKNEPAQRLGETYAPGEFVLEVAAGTICGFWTDLPAKISPPEEKTFMIIAVEDDSAWLEPSPNVRIIRQTSLQTAEQTAPEIEEWPTTDLLIIEVYDKVPWPLPPPPAPATTILAKLLRPLTKSQFAERYTQFLEPARAPQVPPRPPFPPPRPEEDLPRNVRAILIAGDANENTGMPEKTAELALNIIEKDLKKRFRKSDVLISRPGPMKDLVAQVFKSMREIVRDGDLFIVMFAGHGGRNDRGGYWHLSNDQHFDTSDLREALEGFHHNPDIVVISNCCYGGATLHLTERPPDLNQSWLQNKSQRRQTELAIYSRTFGRETCDGKERSQQNGNGSEKQARSNWGKPERSRSIICISAASDKEQVLTSNLDDLARETVAAAMSQGSYSALNRHFEKTRVAGRHFHVNGPSDHLERRVLDTSASAMPGHAVYRPDPRPPHIDDPCRRRRQSSH